MPNYQFASEPQPRTIAPSREDVLTNLMYFFGSPTSPEKLQDYSEHHAQTYHFPDVRRRPHGPPTPLVFVATPPRSTLTPTFVCVDTGLRGQQHKDPGDPQESHPQARRRPSRSQSLCGVRAHSRSFFCAGRRSRGKLPLAFRFSRSRAQLSSGTSASPKGNKPCSSRTNPLHHFFATCVLTLLPPDGSKNRRIRFDVRLMQRVPVRSSGLDPRTPHRQCEAGAHAPLCLRVRSTKGVFIAHAHTTRSLRTVC